ncbi:S49 family peptidase [uncultured Maritimibacter sp.]|jgi:ClpP class serine protease|uniref:S49 family peptidase n=1 Tax=uncultured Maritimibacter sp. TaxID=991866 RepID=UPI000A56475F|nr:S49 family peptidase [uncultured Maritimibacter sp.]
MTGTTIAAMLAGQTVAIAQEYAGALLSLEARREGAPGEAVAMVERYAISGGVAVVPVRGLLTPNTTAFEEWFGWTTYFGLVDTMSRLAANGDVRAIVLDIDSPGGLVTGCADAGAAVAAAALVKPVHAFADPVAASAAYWIASQATEVSLSRGSIVGSIGTATSSATPVAPGSSGYQWFDFTSSHAASKIPDPSTEAGRAEIQRRIDASEAEFHAAVEAGRGMAAGELVGRMSTTGDPRDGGAVWSGADAVNRGLADRVETRAEFMARIVATYQAANDRRGGRAHRALADAAQAIAAS